MTVYIRAWWKFNFDTYNYISSENQSIYVYITQKIGLKSEKNGLWVSAFLTKNQTHPPFRPEKNLLRYRLYCIQKNRHCNTGPTQQSVSQSKYMGLRYLPRHVPNSLTKPNRQYLELIGGYLSPTNSD